MGREAATVDKIMKVLPSVLGMSHKRYIVLDALDECEEREDLLEILATFLSIQSVNLLVTSRKERDITDALQMSVTFKFDLESTLVDADVWVHVQRCLETDKQLKKWPISVKEEICESLIMGAHGMFVSFSLNLTVPRFRLVECQLDALRKCLN